LAAQAVRLLWLAMQVVIWGRAIIWVVLKAQSKWAEAKKRAAARQP
jgi:hypothetical protein